MLSDFNTLFYDAELNDLLSSINETDIDVYTACHGSYHAKFVAARIGKILLDLHFDNRTIEIGKITGLLHDIGCIDGKHGHSIKSSKMCEKYLRKINISTFEKDAITQAIADHSNGDNIKHAIGAALLIADKTDLSKERVLNHANINSYHKNLLEVESVDITIQETDMIINFIATDKFSPILLNNLWSKAFTVPVKAAKHLGLSARFMINDVPLEL